MRRTLAHWMLALAVAIFGWLPLAQAQRPGETPPTEEAKSYPLAYALAFLGTVLVMVILCTPSRKKMV